MLKQKMKWSRSIQNRETCTDERGCTKQMPTVATTSPFKYNYI